MPRPRRTWLLPALVLLAGLVALAAWRASDSPVPSGEIGLFTTLPIVWSESEEIGDLLRSDGPAHWARGAIERYGKLAPLDQLAAPAPGSIARLDRLVMAQPRALSPQENVALDEWVRGGGKLLLLADPMLTEESAFAIGDRRRPQDVALLSPILSHWGLELRFDEAQPLAESRVDVMGKPVPVRLPGYFTSIRPGACRFWAGGSAVTCAIGQGRILALADAAVVEQADPDGAREEAFDWLLETAFAGR